MLASKSLVPRILTSVRTTPHRFKMKEHVNLADRYSTLLRNEQAIVAGLNNQLLAIHAHSMELEKESPSINVPFAITKTLPPVSTLTISGQPRTSLPFCAVANDSRDHSDSAVNISNRGGDLDDESNDDGDSMAIMSSPQVFVANEEDWELYNRLPTLDQPPAPLQAPTVVLAPDFTQTPKINPIVRSESSSKSPATKVDPFRVLSSARCTIYTDVFLDIHAEVTKPKKPRGMRFWGSEFNHLGTHKEWSDVLAITCNASNIQLWNAGVKESTRKCAAMFSHSAIQSRIEDFIWAAPNALAFASTSQQINNEKHVPEYQLGLIFDIHGKQFNGRLHAFRSIHPHEGRNGISALCRDTFRNHSASKLNVYTGGYDHRIVRWNIVEAEKQVSASVENIHASHTSVVADLFCKNGVLFSGGVDGKVFGWDLMHSTQKFHHSMIGQKVRSFFVFILSKMKRMTNRFNYDPRSTIFFQTQSIRHFSLLP